MKVGFRKTTRSKLTIIISIFLLLTVSMPVNANAVTQEEIDDAIASGVAWLVSQQAADGRWHSTWRNVGETGAALATLGHHAELLGKSPVDPDYEYYNNVQKGLDYLFAQANREESNNWVHWGSNDVYSIGPALMGIAETNAPDRVVDVPGSAVDGMTYFQVAQEIVNYIAHGQIKDGNGIGMWYYSIPHTTGDISIAGWITLGLGYAKEKLGIPLPQSMLDNLSTGIDIAQWTEDPNDIRYGGVGYMSNRTPPYSNWINIYKVGHILYMMDLVGDTAASERVQRSLGFLERHWDVPNSGANGYPSMVNGHFDVGWRGGPGDSPNPLPSYIATLTVMKGLVALGIDNVGEVDWQADFNEVVVANQHPNGYWDQGGYPTGYRNMSTIWAILTLMRATSVTPVTGVRVNPTELNLLVGDEPVTLLATVLPADADNKNVIWSSDNENVAAVVDGVVTPLSPGTAVITVTTEDGGFVAQCTVTVNMREGWHITKTADAHSITLGRGVSISIDYTITTNNIDSQDETMLVDNYLELNGVQAMWSDAVDGVLSIGGFEFTREPEFSGPLTPSDNLEGGTYTYNVTVKNVSADDNETFRLVNEASLYAGEELINEAAATVLISTPAVEEEERELPQTGGRANYGLSLLLLAGGVLLNKKRK